MTASHLETVRSFKLEARYRAGSLGGGDALAAHRYAVHELSFLAFSRQPSTIGIIPCSPCVFIESAKAWLITLKSCAVGQRLTFSRLRGLAMLNSSGTKCIPGTQGCHGYLEQKQSLMCYNGDACYHHSFELDHSSSHRSVGCVPQDS